MIPLKEGQVVRLFNFRTKFFADDKIYVTIDKYGNMVEENSVKIDHPKTSYNVSEEVWEAEVDNANKD